MSLEEFKNRHQGRPAYIIGSGPSLHFENLHGLRDEVVFAVNSAVLKFRNAKYFVSNDASISDWEYYFKVLPAFSGQLFLRRDMFKDIADGFPPNRLTYFDHAKSKYSEEGGFSMDSEHSLLCPPCSSITAAHLACIMGCSPIILLGNDGCYLADKEQYWGFPKEVKPIRLRGNNISSPRTMSNGKVSSKALYRIVRFWELVKRDNPGVDIINASCNGLVDCFPRQPLSDCITRY
jgi:hypothetical protein